MSVELLLRNDIGIRDMEAYVKENIELFNKKALKKIAGSRKYQKYDVPTDYLKLYGVGTLSKSSIRMNYELKRAEVYNENLSD